MEDLVSARPHAFAAAPTSDEDVVVVVHYPTLPRDGGMAEDHGAPEAVQLSRAWTRRRRETESRQRVSGEKSP